MGHNRLEEFFYRMNLGFRQSVSRLSRVST